MYDFLLERISSVETVTEGYFIESVQFINMTEDDSPIVVDKLFGTS